MLGPMAIVNLAYGIGFVRRSSNRFQTDGEREVTIIIIIKKNGDVEF